MSTAATGESPRPRPLAGIVQWAATAAAYVLLAILHTYPLVRHLGTHLPGEGLGDNVSFVWNLWWLRQALASAESFFHSPLILAPLGGSLVLHTHTALSGVLAATVVAPLPVVAAQNVMLIASLALNGLSVCVLTRLVTGRHGASVAAGALFLVAPAITARLMGHFNLVVAWPLVFACVALVAWWRSPRPWRTACLVAAVALVPYADYYHAVFFGLFALLYSATELWQVSVRTTRRPPSRSARALAALAAIAFLVAGAVALSPSPTVTLAGMRISVRTPTNAFTVAWLLSAAAAIGRWRVSVSAGRGQRASAAPSARHVAVAAAAILVLLAPLALAAWQLVRNGDYVTQSSSLRSSPRGADAATIALGPPYSGLAGPFVRAAYRRLTIDPMEGSAWIGGITLLLLAWAIRTGRSGREARRWAAIAGFFALWSLGPYLGVAGANTGLLLPEALARLLPIVNNARIPGRAMVMVALAVSMVIGVALAAAPASRRRLLCAIVVLAVVENIAAPLPLVALSQPGVYRRVAGDLTGSTVLPLPFGLRDGFGERGRLEHDAMYQQTLHGHPLVGGFLARIPPRVWGWYDGTEPFRTLLALSSGDTVTQQPACTAIASGLAAARVGFVVLYRDEATDTLRRFAIESMPLRQIAEDEHRTLFEVRSEGCVGQ